MRTLKKVLSLFISLAILLSALLSVTVFAQSGDVTGGEVRLDSEGHTLVLRSVVPPTCTEEGYSIYYCEICQLETNLDYTDPTGHTESDWIIDVKPTAEAPGHKYKKCMVCHTLLSEEIIPMLEHRAGDINQDGCVDNLDITALLKYLTGLDVSVDELVLDVNGDKAVNNKDLTRLFRYLSGLDVQIFGIVEEQSGSNGKIDDNGNIYLPEAP